MSNRPAILAEGLHKHYGKTQALPGLDLVAREGRVLALLTAALVAWGAVRIRPLEALRYE